MELPHNPFKAALRAGRRQIGLWSALVAPASVELLAGAGFDWLMLDMEHAPIDFGELRSELMALNGSATHPIVRPPWNDAVAVKRILDLGVQTLLFPVIQSAAEATAAVAATRYPPDGVRGVAGGTRATRYGRVADYYRLAQDELCVIMQIETRAGLDNLDAILAVEGVDAVFLGPADLSASLGHLGAPRHPDVVAAMEDALHRCVAAGKPVGTISQDETVARRWLDLGASFVAVGVDVLLFARAADTLAAKFRT
jgi:4-hydroxy-2-oxoheptanedioate aldolase